jgi:2-aminoethylphosphonate-pyruvate transaminase
VTAVASVPAARDKLLFTPGPLTTSLSVKQAMLHDAGSWHFEFNALVKEIHRRLLALAGVSQPAGYEAILLQGSGTFGVEAVFLTCVPPHGKVCVLANGAYGERMALMLQHAKMDHLVLRTPEDTPADPAALERALAADPAITHVAAVHCETTTGILNPIDELGAITKTYQRCFIVDAMSSFGALPIGVQETGIDYLISSANKCLEGVPGFSFVICRRAALLACEGWARSLSLDLLGQFKGFEKNGQFRYTPPTHAILAFRRHWMNWMTKAACGHAARVISATIACWSLAWRSWASVPICPRVCRAVSSPAFAIRRTRFDFDIFYRSLSDKGFIIYPGKISQADTFRIGSIGRLFRRTSARCWRLFAKRWKSWA